MEGEDIDVLMFAGTDLETSTFGTNGRFQVGNVNRSYGIYTGETGEAGGQKNKGESTWLAPNTATRRSHTISPRFSVSVLLVLNHQLWEDLAPPALDVLNGPAESSRKTGWLSMVGLRVGSHDDPFEVIVVGRVKSEVRVMRQTRSVPQDPHQPKES